jgi:uncharacterized membrane protein
MWPKYKHHIPLLLIILLAAAVRLLAVFIYGDFWDDEMFNFIYSQKSWPSGLMYWLWETNPPLHLLILRIWLFIFPATEFFARLPSVLAGVGTVYVIYRFGRDFFGAKTAYLAAIFLALHPYHIFWSATSRVYVFLMLFAALSVWRFFQIYFSENQPGRRRSAAFINLLLIFSHLSSLFLLAGQLIALIIFKGKKSVIDWIKLNLLPGLIGAVWILASFAVKSGNDLGKSWFLNMAHSFNSSINSIANIIVGQYPIFGGIILVGLAVTVLGLTAVKKFRIRDVLFLSLLVTALTPIALAAVCGVWHVKFFMAVLPLIVLLIAEGVSQFIKIRPAIAIITAICTIGLIRLTFTLPLSDWTDVENFYFSRNNGKAVFVYNNYILKSQIDRYLPAISGTAKPLILYENMNWDDMVVKKNYLFTMLSDEAKDEWYASNNFGLAERIILLQGEYDYMNKLNTVFEKHGWILREAPRRARLSGSYNLYFYEKN